MSGFMDKAKDALNQAKDKAGELATQHGDKIDRSIAKAGDFVDQKTGGKYADKVDRAQTAARGASDRLAGQTATGTPVAPVPDPAAPVPPTPDPTAGSIPPVGPDDPAGPPPRV